MRQLERQGSIQGYTALLNPHYLDAPPLVFVEITLNHGAPDVFEQFNTAVRKLEEVQGCHLVSGDFSYLLETRMPDMSAYRRLLGETLLRLPSVNDTRTYVVMEEVRQSDRLVTKARQHGTGAKSVYSDYTSVSPCNNNTGVTWYRCPF